MFLRNNFTPKQQKKIFSLKEEKKKYYLEADPVLEDFLRKKLYQAKSENNLLEIKKESSFLGLLEGQDDHPLKPLFIGSLAIRNKNESWLEKTWRTFIFTNPFSYEFFQPKYPLLEEEMLGKTLSFIDRSYSDELFLKVFEIELAKHFPIGSDLHNAIRGNFNLAQIRSNINHPKWGNSFISFWYEQYRLRGNPKEVKNYLEKNLTPGVIKKFYTNLFTIFPHYFPTQVDQRDEVLFQMNKDFNSNKKNDQFRYFFLMDNDEIRKAFFSKYPLAKNESHIFRKRQFYRTLFKNKVAVDLSMFYLLKIGDYSEEFLWWTIL